MWLCKSIYTFLIVFIHLVTSVDITLRLDNEKHYLMTIDLDSQQDIESQIEAFFETHANNVDVRFNEKLIRKTAERKLLGVKLRTAIGNDEEIQEICGSTLTDVDASVLYEFVELLLKDVKEETIEGNNELYEVGMKDGPKFLYVEVGSYLGCSSILMASILPPASMIYAHDIWVDTSNGETLGEEGGPPKEIDNYFYKFYDNIRNRGLEKKVIPIRGNSTYTLGIHHIGSITMGFVDGDHSYQGVMRDLKSIYPLVKSGGIILVHDVIKLSWTINSAGQAMIDFCSEMGDDVLCQFMIAGTEIAKIYKL